VLLFIYLATYYLRTVIMHARELLSYSNTAHLNEGPRQPPK
jgi:hypothetical protein